MTAPTTRVFRTITRLLLRAAGIDAAVQREMRRRHPAPLRLLQLKKLQLTIRHRLARAGFAPVAQG